MYLVATLDSNRYSTGVLIVPEEVHVWKSSNLVFLAPDAWNTFYSGSDCNLKCVNTLETTPYRCFIQQILMLI